MPHWVTTEEEARKAVGDEVARDVDIIKIWVDDRNGQYKKLAPELYGPVIDEAHQRGKEVTAHIFNLEDAKGLLRAGIDAFAHGVRDKDVDDELVAMVKERANVALVPNMPDRGVATDLDWLAGSIPSEELQKLKSAATERPEAAPRSHELVEGNGAIGWKLLQALAMRLRAADPSYYRTFSRVDETTGKPGHSVVAGRHRNLEPPRDLVFRTPTPDAGVSRQVREVRSMLAGRRTESAQGFRIEMHLMSR